jgi:hypothetical protein
MLLKNATDINDKTVHEITMPVRHLSTDIFLGYREAQFAGSSWKPE